MSSITVAWQQSGNPVYPFLRDDEDEQVMPTLNDHYLIYRMAH
ncbi:MAG: hypothetical protein ABW157_13220 [Candidatus Thiodiazotropha sp. LLP2]